MPQLLMFVPCEKTLINENTRTLSLITILDTLTVGIPAGIDIPADASIPMQWNTVTYWGRTPDDVGKLFEQRIFLQMPDGRQSVERTVEFEFTGKAHSNIAAFTNFPIGVAGDYFLVLTLREAGTQANWKEIVKFPMTITHGYDKTDSGNGQTD